MLRTCPISTLRGIVEVKEHDELMRSNITEPEETGEYSI